MLKICASKTEMFHSNNFFDHKMAQNTTFLNSLLESNELDRDD